MTFRRKIPGDEPEVNLIPLIDVLLVILIFLAATTSFTRYNQLRVSLPEASASATQPATIDLAISRDGLYALNGQLLAGADPQEMADAMRNAASSQEQAAVLVINADGQASHAAVVRALEAARLAGISRINFATRSHQ